MSLAVETTVPSSVPAVIDHAPPAGSQPLRNPRHERYARLRSLLRPKAEAYREAGFESESQQSATGNANKLEGKRAVAARIAWLCRQDEDVLRAKRQRLEEFLWGIHETNYAEFFEPVERPQLDAEGEETGYLIREHSLKPFADLTREQQMMIASLRYTEKGNPILETYSKLTANIELRKLLGIGAKESPDAESEFSRLPDVELLATLRSEAKALGIDVDLTYRIKGSEAA